MIAARVLLRTGGRPLSTAAATLPLEPPIALFGIAGRYATAIYSAAAKKNDLLNVEADLNTFTAQLNHSKALQAFVTDPGISRANKSSAIREVLDVTKASQTTKNAFATIAEGGRLNEVRKVIDMYGSLMSAAKGEVTAVITSSREIKPEEMVDLRAKVDSFLEAGQTKVHMQVKVDPGLIHGVTIEIGDKFIDYSVATQLKKLAVLLDVGV